ncbi:MAG: DNA polymerase I [bacterium]|nr:DNA polymerase I [bacterium]
MKRLMLIDAMASLYRSYFAMAKNPLTDARGMNVAALFGFMNTLLSLLEKEKPDFLAVCTDSSEPTFRHQMFSEYKATRDVMPDELQLQVPYLYNLLKAMNIKVLQSQGYEADDIIATIVNLLPKHEWEIIIVSGDKDLVQLLQDNVRILSPDRKTAGVWNEVTKEKVIEKFGVPPEQLKDWLAIVGDTSDNVPGIPKLGPKAATDLLKQYGNLENILQNAHTIDKKGWKETLLENVEQAKLSKSLVELVANVPLEISPTELTFGPFSGDELRDQLNKLGFRSILKKVMCNESSSHQEQRNYQLITTISQLDEVIQQLEQANIAAIDTETTSADPNRAILVAISISVNERQGWCIHLPSFQNENLGQQHASNENFLEALFQENYEAVKIDPSDPYPAQRLVLTKLKPWLENESKLKCGQNIKYDHIVLSRAGIEVKGWAADTMLMSYLIDPLSRSHGLDVLSQKYLSLPKIPITALLNSGKSPKTMDQVPKELLVNYACEDADYTRRLFFILKEKLIEQDLQKLHDEIELPLALVLAKMEIVGIKVDREVLKKLSIEFSQEQKELEKEIFRLVGHPFNLSSPIQLSKVLFEELQLKPVKKTKTGYSTNEEVLEKLAELDPTVPVPKLLLRYRMLAKLLNTYIDALPKIIHPITQRVHTNFNQAVTATGRLSSTEPNLQNIPIRTEEGAKIRTAFVAGYPNWKLISADYSQIELRIMAHLSQDETLIQAFHQGQDIHTLTASKVYNVPIEEVTPAMRRSAKAVNFGMIYGQTDFGLSTTLDIPLEEAQSFRNQYFQTYPGVQEYMQKTIAFAREKNYVQTMFNRKRAIPEINSDQRVAREFAERTAINTPIQGTAADIIKVAMIRLDQAFEKERKQNGLKAQLLLQVHDELLFEAPSEEIEWVTKMVKECMENVIELSVPLVVDIGIGNNWLEAH